MKSDQRHLVDSAHAMLHAQWGSVVSAIGILMVISVGFYLGSPNSFFPDSLLASGYNGLVFIFGGPLAFLMIPLFGFAIIWCMILDRPPIVILGNLFCIQIVNAAVGLKGDEMLVALVICALLIGNLLLFVRWIKRRQNKARE